MNKHLLIIFHFNSMMFDRFIPADQVDELTIALINV